MKLRSTATTVLALLLVSCAPYPEMRGQTYLGFTMISTYGAPPPPRVVIVDRDDAYERVPDSRVYVVRDPGADCDVFRYGPGFYIYSGGYWYRSFRSDGGFLAIDVRSVPRPVLEVPDVRWRHHPHDGPPGQQADGRDRHHG